MQGCNSSTRDVRNMHTSPGIEDFTHEFRGGKNFSSCFDPKTDLDWLLICSF